MNNKKITIAGVGVVGLAVDAWLKLKGINASHYDPPKGISNKESLRTADLVFVCVPTPYVSGLGYDDLAVENVLSQLEDHTIVIIKSTVLPGTTDRYQKQFPKLKIIFNPEFLVQNQATADFIKPTRQIVGYSDKSRSIASRILKFLPPSPYSRVVKAVDAELIKYFGNIFLATKVIFANEFYDIANAVGADYEVVAEAAGSDPRIGTSHLNIWHDDYRGYGGACLPKDVNTMVDFVHKKKIRADVLEAVKMENDRLIKLAKKL